MHIRIFFSYCSKYRACINVPLTSRVRSPRMLYLDIIFLHKFFFQLYPTIHSWFISKGSLLTSGCFATKASYPRERKAQKRDDRRS